MEIAMWIADNWKDYEVIDCSKGEKLERWGDYLLVRPDPQVIWDTPKTERGWRKMNGHYHRSAKGGGEWEFFDLPQQWTIHYGKLTFNLKPFSFKHTGLFPEQAFHQLDGIAISLVNFFFADDSFFYIIISQLQFFCCSMNLVIKFDPLFQFFYFLHLDFRPFGIFPETRIMSA